MIYTITVNPSIDYVLQLKNLNTGEVNRTQNDVKLPGGKGINVSRIMKELNIDSTALGFIGGATGSMFEELLSQHNLKTSFTRVKEDTRINVKINATEQNEETEINGAGPVISDDEQENFMNNLNEIGKGDIVVMAGSLCRNLNTNFYLDIAEKIQKQGAEFIIDTTGQALLDTLPLHPLVVKPNHHELADLFKVTFKDEQEIITYARKLLDKGAKHVLVSMAGDGALLVTKDKAYKANAPKGTVINSVGAGDSMIAGFAGTFMETNDPIESFHMGAACGSATAFSQDIAIKEKIDEVYKEISIIEI
ncbi:1-phosphofructokinase (fructose-1-phosphate kinase) [Companilactobacillus paralimentarius DSM 13238 = JCM 10415]|uniref:Tagatose-6-phosphate kinase n=1 Tax=Companilactobacillus paralimentarius DSM 13238 = JCM 10415 TaxID=1122151 RepID=A0A0R1PTR5_9LACO|nr:1-phosphofructokinase [Companilactobacillus paralimentarius]KAE9562673.1 1-phosphofructokinase [Companilactobacillus paralimentarius]KRL32171.1 1-phosphofructokinase (fructose-1-phosphate kinase) [Companilactobacillus paralimentarius DSM 13238 = JCM 10415]MDR4933877.1 1-phosphofructokinase [Companilactobacillus paralimentarius]QFR70301.1 1-phosphofructokinase [Companilactobacillus paralimentarius]